MKVQTALLIGLLGLASLAVAADPPEPVPIALPPLGVSGRLLEPIIPGKVELPKLETSPDPLVRTKLLAIEKLQLQKVELERQKSELDRQIQEAASAIQNASTRKVGKCTVKVIGLLDNSSKHPAILFRSDTKVAGLFPFELQSWKAHSDKWEKLFGQEVEIEGELIPQSSSTGVNVKADFLLKVGSIRAVEAVEAVEIAPAPLAPFTPKLPVEERK